MRRAHQTSSGNGAVMCRDKEEGGDYVLKPQPRHDRRNIRPPLLPIAYFLTWTDLFVDVNT